MEANPLLGVILHMIGGLASASFYIPYGKVKKWSWETYWLVGGFFSWIIAPWTLALIISPDLFNVIAETPLYSLSWAYLFGVMWGMGGLTFGLTMRYLGISLGMAIALGYCAAFGTLMPPIVDGTLIEILPTAAGIATLIGVLVCLGGIAVTGMAGMSKERELSDEKKKETIKEFNFVKGILVATFSGIMSAGMSYGFRAGEPIAKLAVEYGTPSMLQNLPVLCVVLAGGFTTNFIWCVGLNLKNRSGGQYFDFSQPRLWLANLFFSAVAGVTWYMQFFFYGMGETKIGPYKFSSWTLHMASIIIFSTCWGILLHEWRGSSRHTFKLLATGLAVLILSLIIVGYGNYLNIPAK
ncbi:MAG: L-rhamnose/proton symporter RhaT [Planctomycetia bacterium]|nr:L-rhamnose/proton symporter RhaT [Planctomycetia bacterium]